MIMNRPLSDPERIELTTLCGALADGCLSASDGERLNVLLRTGDEARVYYVQHAGLSASLFSYAAEMQSDAPAPMPVRKVTIPKGVWWGAAAAAIVVVAGVILKPSPEPLAVVPSEASTVALMTGTKDCEWNGQAMPAGASVKAGQKLQLTKGTAEITFDSGAQVTLDGPASLVVSSAWDASLESGTIKANIPEEAAGFRVINTSVEVVDQGAEFSMIADASSAEVLVLKGSVEAASHDNNVQPLFLKALESRRFETAGTSEVKDRDRKFAKFAKILTLDRNPPVAGYTHWTFDSSEGAAIVAEVKGRKKAGVHTRMVADDKVEAVAAASLTEGRWGKGLGFDGHLSAKATVPGLAAQGEARTLAFWTRVPANASLTGGSATMLGWGEKARKHETSRITIGWNKKHERGPVGALRSDLGQGVMVGSSNVRDGRWHHVAVVLQPMANGHLQARQYVDGRLEGSATSPAPYRITTDTLWLGRGPLDRPKDNKFTGVLDELFVVDRPLSPSEIVRLMRENQPPETMVAGTL